MFALPCVRTIIALCILKREPDIRVLHYSYVVILGSYEEVILMSRSNEPSSMKQLLDSLNWAIEECKRS